MDYVKEALRTECQDYSPAGGRLGGRRNLRLLHAAMGLNTEASEALDALKKHVFYGKELDTTNLVEELGDLFWYIAIMADELGVSFEKIQELNLAKLKARYTRGFSEKDACDRKLGREREILEGRVG